VGDPALTEGWAGGSPEGPAKPGHRGILSFCVRTIPGSDAVPHSGRMCFVVLQMVYEDGP